MLSHNGTTRAGYLPSAREGYWRHYAVVPVSQDSYEIVPTKLTLESCELPFLFSTPVTVMIKPPQHTLHWMFCQKHEKNESLPSRSYSLSQHIRTALMTKSPAPTSLLELKICKFNHSAYKKDDFCQCKANCIPCTEACLCMNNEICQNTLSLGDQ